MVLDGVPRELSVVSYVEQSKPIVFWYDYLERIYFTLSVPSKNPIVDINELTGCR